MHTRVYDNGHSFRKLGVDAAGLPGARWVTLPQHFKEAGWTTLGGGKTFHPDFPADWDEPRSWSPDMPYYGFSYYTNPLNATYPGPCPGPGAPIARPGVGSPLPSDTWCALDEPLDHFYDHGLANNTIARLRHAAGRLKAEERPFFVMSGFARPHAPWRIPQRFWDMYRTEDIPLPKHRLPPTNMPGIAWFPLNFYNSSNGRVFPLTITSPLDLWAQRHMRHAYYAAVSFLDFEVGRVLDELDSLAVADQTAVVFHGDHSGLLRSGPS